MRPPIVDILASDPTDLFAQIDRGTRADGYAYQFEGKPLPKLSGLPIRDVNMNFGQGFLHLLSDPNIAFILFTIGFYGLLSELFHPNFFTGPTGGIALVLAFIGSNSLPLNVGGLLLILLGIGLLVLELTVTSFGLLTVGGVVSIVLGAFALWTGVNPAEDAIRVSISPWLLGVVVALSLLYVFGIIRALLAMRRRPVEPMPMLTLVGAGGVAQTLIAPKGIAYARGEAWSARSSGPEIAAGTPVKVVGVDGLELIVEPGDQAQAERPA
jgi:membrane-bound serine protease (ClpP class)